MSLTPAHKYIKAVHELAFKTSGKVFNPEDDEEIIIHDACAFEFETIPGLPKWVHLISVRALDPGKGKGTKAMRAIMKLADNMQVAMVGKIRPYADKNLTKKQLQKWYAKFNILVGDNISVRLVPGTSLEDLKKIDKRSKEKINSGFGDWDYEQSISKKRKTVLGTGFLLLGSIFLFGR